MLKVFRVIRYDCPTYGEDWGMVVVACDETWAETIARQKSSDFRKARLEVEEIDLTTEGVILVANVGG